MKSNRYLIRVESSLKRQGCQVVDKKWEKSKVCHFSSFILAKIFAKKWTKKIADPYMDFYVFTHIYLLPEDSNPIEMDSPKVRLLAQRFPGTKKWFHSSDGEQKMLFERDEALDRIDKNLTLILEEEFEREKNRVQS